MIVAQDGTCVIGFQSGTHVKAMGYLEGTPVEDYPIETFRTPESGVLGSGFGVPAE